jgi:hypothetical protein
MHLGFCLLRYCATEATSSRSLMWIYDQESRSPEPSSSAILHRERADKIFGKRSSQLLTCFFKFFITAHLPLHRTRVEGRCLQRKLRQAECRLHPIIIIKESQVMYDFSSQIMSYILNMLIYVGIILLDNLFQCLLFITMIDLSRTYDSIAILTYNALVMFMIYPWIKIKLKMLLFQQSKNLIVGTLVLWLYLFMR